MRIAGWNTLNFFMGCGVKENKTKSYPARKLTKISKAASKITMGGEGDIPEYFCGTSCGTFGEGQGFYG